MPIKKQEFYEGAALHLLARTGKISGVRYEAPLFVINGWLSIHVKYSTRGRSPWGFTFTPDEQVLLLDRSSRSRIIIGLVCGSDGVACLPYDDYLKIASPRRSAVHIACYRKHREHYDINGPDGGLLRNVAPSSWQGILAPEVGR